MIYPVTLTEDPESGQIMARFPDVPEAITVAKSREDAMSWALDALIVALSGYMDSGRAIPSASKVGSGESSVALPVLVAAKLAVYEAMREQGLTQLSLAQKLGTDPRQVRRILDLDHRSRMDQVEDALESLGKRLIVTVKKAA